MEVFTDFPERREAVFGEDARVVAVAERFEVVVVLHEPRVKYGVSRKDVRVLLLPS